MTFPGATMGNLLAKCAATDFAIQWSLWVVAAALKTEKFYELAGSGTFLLLAYQSLKWGETYFARQRIQSGMVMLWALRLCLFLFTRGLKEDGDTRFNKVRNNPSTFFIYWTIQGVWIFIKLLPTLLLNGTKEDRPLMARDYVGWTMSVVGWLCEVIADYQKSAFRNNPDNAGKFISTGLWSVSRHPNYLGEILLWTGLYVSAGSVLRGRQHLAVLSPMLVAFLLTRVSGVPILEQQALKRWGQNPQYREYTRTTAVLVPFIY